MFETLFGVIRKGRLTRLPYFGYSLLLALVMFAFVFAVILLIGAGEHILGGDLQQAQDQLREWFTLPFLVVFGLLSSLLTFAGINIMAKRIRDIGLPGWWMILAITALEVALSFVFSGQSGSGFHTFVWLALLFIPTNTFARKG